MNRLLAVVAATAAAAAVAAAITLPAGADPSTGDGADAAFVSCLRSHGAQIPADTRGFAIKQWLIAHEQDNGVNAALDACNPKTDKAGPDELVTCLRSHGLDLPADNGALKAWIVAHRDDASAQGAFKACEFNPRPPDEAKDITECLAKNGADVPANLDGAALKQWILAHQDSAAVKACMGPVDKPGEGCGAGKPETRPAPAPAETPDPVPTASVEQ